MTSDTEPNIRTIWLEFHSPVPEAMTFAVGAHEAAQTVRKYTGESYTVHLEAVANTTWHYSADPIMTAAAWLHDVVEDTPITDLHIRKLFGSQVADIVDGLTDRKYPSLNRAARMDLHRQRLAQASREVQTVKCADLIDNTRNITQHDPKFARVYLEEKRLLLWCLDKADSEIHQEAEHSLYESFKLLGMKFR